jgi:hypothetical protein
MVEKSVAQEPRHGEHHWVDPDNDGEMDKINVIFRGSMSIASKTQGKKLKRERERERDQPDSAHRAKEKNELV